MTEYNPDVQAELIQSGVCLADIANVETVPTIGLLANAYGREMPIEWLKVQLGSLNDYAEQSEGIKPEQLAELTSLIIGKYYYLNMMEICMFIARFKLGHYGEFFGAVGPMRIASGLKNYVIERRREIEIKERDLARIAQEKQREEWRKTSITYEEYERRKQLRTKKNEQRA